MHVEVVYPLPARQQLFAVELAAGATVADAIAAAALMPGFPAVDAGRARVGIFGRLATPGTELREGDRVEIYRPLRVDPKQARRRRAEKKGGKVRNR